MPLLARISIAFFSGCSIFVSFANAQPGIPVPNPVVRPMYPSFRQPYPITQPSYQVPNYRTNYPQGAVAPFRPFRQLAHSDHAAQSSAWTQNVIKQEDRSYDFKTVAKGTKCEHSFEIYNPCAEKLHIAGVSASCTCTTPFLLDDKAELQTYEKTVVVAHFNTNMIQGEKSATITVIIDKPQYAEIQLHVQGVVRSDISMTPNEVRFDQVAEGKGAERTVEVVYTGNMANWRIVDFACPNKNLSAEIVEQKGEPGRISSKIRISLAADTPPGVINERFHLRSNDSDSRRDFPILVSATVGKVVTVTPQTRFLGYLKPGEASRQEIVVVRGTERFKITKIECDDPNVEIRFTPNPDAQASLIHRIPITFKNPADGSPKLNNGTLHAVVNVETDDPNQKLSFNVTAKIVDEASSTQQ